MDFNADLLQWFINFFHKNISATRARSETLATQHKLAG